MGDFKNSSTEYGIYYQRRRHSLVELLLVLLIITDVSQGEQVLLLFLVHPWMSQLELEKIRKEILHRAAKQCAEMIQNGLKDSIYKNKFLLNFISGPVMPSLPGVGQKKYIRSGFISKFAIQALGLSQTIGSERTSKRR